MVSFGDTIVYNFLIYLVWLKPTVTLDQLYLNVIPFKTLSQYISDMLYGTLPFSIAVTNLLGNILLTSPIGLFLSRKNMKNIKVIYLFIGIPVLVGLVQLLLYLFKIGTRTVDKDDVLLNMLGIMVGYYFSRMVLSKKYGFFVTFCEMT
ncbi:VanZ family protein [Aeribacillus pallidus]|nr:VanZ family protein [Aeribacillus pallidus]